MGACGRRVSQVVLTAVLAASGLGCAAQKPYRPLDSVPRLDARAIEVAPVPVVPETEFRVAFSSGASGGVTGFLVGGGLGALAGAGAGPWVAAGLALLVGPVSGLSCYALGAVAEAESGNIRAAEALLKSTVGEFDIARSVAESFREAQAAAGVGPIPPPVAAPDTGSGKTRGADGPVVLDVTPKRVFLSGVGIFSAWSPPSDPATPRFYLVVSVRASLPSEGREVHAEDFLYAGPRRPLSSWIANGGALLREELARGSREIGRNVVDQFFLLAELPLIPAVTLTLAPPCGLAAFADMGGTGAWPTLDWVSFPRPDDLKATPGLEKRVTDVRYDLRVWEAVDDMRGPLVYERDGLHETTHRVEARLPPGTRYLWTVRARFLLDGKVRTTQWSAFSRGGLGGGCDSRGRVPRYEIYHSFVAPSP
jgi:hypothetical protein